jgi:hypothetical protein
VVNLPAQSTQANYLTPLKAIRRKCLDCCTGSAKEVGLCPARDCPLHGFRAGKNPRRAGIGGNPGLEAKRA